MSDLVFNIAKGAIAEKVRDGANLGLLLIKVKEADATLLDRDTITDLLTGNTEANFTNYTRKTISNGSVTLTVDDVNDRVDISVPTQTFTAAGGATNNSLLLAVFYEDTGSDATRVPLTMHTATATTDGNDLQLTDASGILRVT